jgi:uncharacterized FAD-dependent dehydrogenase
MKINKTVKKYGKGKASNKRKSKRMKTTKSPKPTLRKKIFKKSLTNLSTREILQEALDLESMAEMEEKSESEIEPKIINDLSSLAKTIKRNQHGGYIVFGDEHHGDLAFDLIIKLYPNLNEELQEILNNAYYFIEGENQLDEIKEQFGKKHIALDKTEVDNTNYDELKRNYQANTDWPEVIMKNIHTGLHIIAVGRSHIYSIKGKKTGSELETVISFQDTLKKITRSPVTVFAMNNNITLNYDDYNEQSGIHELDEVTNNPKIRSIFTV